MNRLQTYYEQIQLPIKALFLGTLLIAFGSVLTNPYIHVFLKLDVPLIVTTAEILLYSGGLILAYFPVYIFVKLLLYRQNDANILVTGILSYLVFTVIMAVLSPSNLPESTYQTLFTINAMGKQIKLFQMGIVGLGLIYFWIKYVFKRKADTRSISQSSYLDNEMVRVVNAVIGAAAIGIIMSYVWPMIVMGIYNVLAFISADVNNPMSLFIYGALERLLALCNLDAIAHREMWLGPLGGTWLNINGETFVGDANIWMAKLQDSMNVLASDGTGKFTTGYYVLNIFAVPGYLLASCSMISNKRVRRRNTVLLVAAIVISWVSGILLPVELLMLFTSPTLYMFHVFCVSFIYAILNGIGATVGFTYLGNLFASTPGNIIDLIGISRQSAMSSKVMLVVLVGIIAFFVYFFVVRFYFSKMAIDILNIETKDERVHDFIERVGGIENIESVSSTPTHIHISLIDRDKLNVAGLHRQGVTRIVETRSGFILSIGSSAYMIQHEINLQMKQLPEVILDEDVE